MLAEALEHLVRGVVDHPDDVTVRDKQTRRGPLLEVRVHPDDLGKVIGRNGRTATAFRTVISALAGRGARGSTSSTSTAVADGSQPGSSASRRSLVTLEADDPMSSWRRH